ncbi:MAG: tail fiber domain-containing protein [Chloroflexi bacterium]|nr:tail fiber domain-containing protein [Chloroflexota bacterium]
MMMNRRFGLLISMVVVFLAGVAMGVVAQDDAPQEAVRAGEAVGGVDTTFTYQGVLTDNGDPADGVYDLQFALYDAAAGGNQIGNTITVADQQVTDGLLTAALDFSENVFSGRPRYLEISVRPGSSTGSYEKLSQRQPLTASPYAIHSGTANTLAAEMRPPTVISVTAASGGSLSQGSYYFKIVTSDGVGTSVGSDEVACAVDGSSSNRCVLAWDAVPGAAAYRIYKGAASNSQNLYQTAITTTYNYDSDSGSTPGAVPITATAFVNNINPSGDSWLLGGNVGIGTTEPSARLEVIDSLRLQGVNSLYPSLDIKNFSGIGIHPNLALNNWGGVPDNPLATPSNSILGTIRFSGFDGNQNIQIGNIDVTTDVGFSPGSSPAQMHFGVGPNNGICCGTYRVTIDGANGNVGIGTTNPLYRFQVGNPGDGTEARANVWNTFSDGRFKTNITPLTNAADLLAEIDGVHFTWTESGEPAIGFVAQDVETVLPEIVSTDAEGYKSMDYSRLTPLLVEAVKEQQTTIGQLEQENTNLQEENIDLRADIAEIRSMLAQEKPMSTVSPNWLDILQTIGLLALLLGGVMIWLRPRRAQMEEK